MKKILSVSITLLLALGIGILTADARGGRSSDDCKPGTTDPDCK